MALPGAEDVEGVTVPAVLLSVRAALPVLTRARSSALAHRACVFWGAAALLALDCAARGLLLPGLCESGHDAWRAGPLGPEDTELIRRLAASMPLEACAVPLSGTGTLLLAPEGLLRGFLDAVADTPPRSPAASLAAGGAAFAAKAPQFVPRRASRAADVAAAYDAGVRLSLRIEVSGPVSAEAGPRFCAVPQLHAVSDPALVVDAAEVWTGTPSAERPGPRARTDALLALPRTAPVWPALERLLSAAVPVAVDLDDEDVTVLLRDAARAPAAAGFEVQWPMELHRRADDRGADRCVVRADRHTAWRRRSSRTVEASPGAPSGRVCRSVTGHGRVPSRTASPHSSGRYGTRDSTSPGSSVGNPEGSAVGSPLGSSSVGIPEGSRVGMPKGGGGRAARAAAVGGRAVG
ncbi:hypothetical protein GCM10020256_68040 [Streptomyces thermocoprophilus]